MIVLLLLINSGRILPFFIGDVPSSCPNPSFIRENCETPADTTVTCPTTGNEFCEALLYDCSPTIHIFYLCDQENNPDYPSVCCPIKYQYCTGRLFRTKWPDENLVTETFNPGECRKPGVNCPGGYEMEMRGVQPKGYCEFLSSTTLQHGESKDSDCTSNYTLEMYGCLAEVPPPPTPDVYSIFDTLFASIWNILKEIWGWLT